MTGSEQVRRVKEFVHFDPASDEYLRVVSLSDLQQQIQTVRHQGPRRSSGSLSEELEGMYQGGYQAALLDVIDRLRSGGIDLEEGKD